MYYEQPLPLDTYWASNRRLASFAIAGAMLTGCTMSFQNISTHGTATDLVDENQTPSTTVSPDIKLSPNMVPGL